MHTESPTIGQIWQTGKDMNKDNALSDLLLQKLYDLHPDLHPKDKITLAERPCHEMLRSAAKEEMEKALAKAADHISSHLTNASYFKWKRID